eukprot:CAMPEP_0178552394 /NCGR_PEP_ID=MMETSP0697-20121206/7273_1 /TAXON_ID=265572 /ORGANISM="Extubocellulus spinifer, Strain CCMP396" /LENGTH=298 /DNA_ID=CAMNT_0020185267 /DNA_START=101 /DNA_END=997 /DNA_ORIENTATION=+
MPNAHRYVAASSLFLCCCRSSSSVSAFISSSPVALVTTTTATRSTASGSSLHASTTPSDIAFDLPNILTAVETFDGSQIVDPVVVSGAFWTSLKAKLLSVIIGQLLATAVFIGISTVIGSQLPKLGDFVGGLLFKEESKAKIQSTVNEFTAKSVDSVKSAGGRVSSGAVQPDISKLLICLLIDAIGTSSELLPIIGEATDVVWAPIAALGLRSLYGSNVVFGLEFLEEILPFTDVIPLATICWCIETFAAVGNLAKTLGIGSYGMNAGTVVDVSASTEQDIGDTSRGRYLKDASSDRK